MKNREKRIDVDLVISGGGIPGICTAIQAARMGLKTALINNRTRFGGNGGSDLMITINGATGSQEFNYNARETGVIEELWLEHLNKNPTSNRWLWDGVLWDMLMKEPNIQLFPNTCIDEVVMESKDRIQYVSGTQNTTETRYQFYAPLFVDNTGDGTVAYLAGAEYRYGREAKAEFGERIAPDEADNCVLPSTMVFTSEVRDHPVRYVAPSFAVDLKKTDVLKYRVIPQNGFGSFKWFYEIDGQLDQVFDAEDILKNHRALVYGIWDYVKNSGEFPAENHELAYISPVMGKREGRRIMGDHILTESDIVEQRDFEDTVGHGGWSIDLHAIDGFYSKEPINRHIFLKGIYQIPYRCGYSKDISNLFMEGRCMSTSHVAFGTTRVIATLSTLGQANAVAAFLCKKYGCGPRDIYQEHLEELRQLLLKHDQYIVGKRYEDETELASKAKVTVSSQRQAGFTDGDEEVRLDREYGLSIPVLKHFGGIRLFAKADADTQLRYAVYKPTKPENYDPRVLVCEGTVDIRKSEDFQTVTLPADFDTETGYYFIWIYANDQISLKCGSRQLTEAVTAKRDSTSSVTLVDLDTLQPKEFIWRMQNWNLCFEYVEQEPIFAGSNLTNGYARPYKTTNAWQAEGVEGEYIQLDWEKPVEISQLWLYLDSYLTELFGHKKDRTEVARPMLVKDFDVEYKDENGNFQTITQVRDNYLRLCQLNFDPVKTDCVRINFHATNGQPYVSVFEVRAY